MTKPTKKRAAGAATRRSKAATEEELQAAREYGARRGRALAADPEPQARTRIPTTHAVPFFRAMVRLQRACPNRFLEAALYVHDRAVSSASGEFWDLVDRMLRTHAQLNAEPVNVGLGKLFESELRRAKRAAARKEVTSAGKPRRRLR